MSTSHVRAAAPHGHRPSGLDDGSPGDGTLRPEDLHHDPNDPGPETPYLLRASAGWAWRVVVLAGATYLLLLLVARLRVVVLAVVAALLLAALVTPVFALLRRSRLPAAGASVLTILLLLGVVGGAGYLVGMGVAGQSSDLQEQVSEGFTTVTDYAARFGVGEEQIVQLQEQVRSTVTDNQQTLVSGAVSTATTVGEVLTGLVLALFVLFFFLKDGDAMWGWISKLFSPHLRGQAYQAGVVAWQALVGYMRGLVLVALVDAVLIGIGLVVLGVPLALPLALVTFIGAFVPIAGAFVAGLLAVLVALVSNGPGVALLVLLLIIVVQQVEGNLLQPIIMRKAVELHPVVIVLAVTAGTTLAGIPGAVVAVPVAALINVVVLYLSRQRRVIRQATDLADAADGDAVPAFPVLATSGTDVEELQEEEQ